MLSNMAFDNFRQALDVGENMAGLNYVSVRLTKLGWPNSGDIQLCSSE